jgi:ubiquinone/menaquinone biosynthesis C-methylase UbiE
MTSETINSAGELTSASTPAEVYEQWYVPAMFGSLAAGLVQALQPQAGTRVLDVACGTGIVARRIAPFVGPRGRVVGLDISPAMLAVACSAAERDGVTIEWQLGRSESLPIPDRSFDLVVSQQGLQFAVDKPAAVAEMRRALAPGGRVAVCVWQGLDRHPFYAAVHVAVLRVLHAPAMQKPFSLDETELRTLLVEAEFDDVRIEPISIEARFADPERYAELQIQAASAAIPMLQQLDSFERTELIEGVRKELEAPIREYTVDGELRFPMHSYLAQARS